MRSNCLIFAWSLYWRRRKRGAVGYVAWRPSRLGTVCGHFLYAEQRHYGWRVVSYVPRDPRHKALPPPMFDGKSKWGDV
jgi:hypothetical protein